MPESVQSNMLSRRDKSSEALTEMTALRAHRQGGPEVLVVERAPVPVPAANEVLVEVHAAAITFDELKWPQTWARDGASRPPGTLSPEGSGVVSDCGPTG